jgi:hypothetical protein
MLYKQMINDDAYTVSSLTEAAVNELIDIYVQQEMAITGKNAASHMKYSAHIAIVNKLEEKYGSKIVDLEQRLSAMQDFIMKSLTTAAATTSTIAPPDSDTDSTDDATDDKNETTSTIAANTTTHDDSSTTDAVNKDDPTDTKPSMIAVSVKTTANRVVTEDGAPS